jgi:hypothetical protein
LATKLSGCGWKVTVYVSVTRESRTLLCVYGLLAEHSGSQALLSLSKLLGGSVRAEMPCLTLAESDRVASDAVYVRFLSVGYTVGAV